MSTRLTELHDRIIAFRDERDWKQFHDLKNLAEAISIEAGELLELFLWKSTAEADEVALDRLREEIADIFIFLIYFCHEAKIDLLDAVSAKLSANQTKYPAEKARGRSDKYSEL